MSTCLVNVCWVGVGVPEQICHTPSPQTYTTHTYYGVPAQSYSGTAPYLDGFYSTTGHEGVWTC